jgi:predicted AAA+ superfamily ATPase
MFDRKLMKEMVQWRECFPRKPLILRGARQVGKTTLVHAFGKQFHQYIYLNLERTKDAQLFHQYPDITELVSRLLLEKRMQLQKLDDTLLFLDEIQELPMVLNQLRYFAEYFPEMCVIAAGSMLESLFGPNLTFPVGRVEFMVLRPFSFEEYLQAMGDHQLIEEYKRVPLQPFAAHALKEAFHTYCILGGMPDIIKHYCQHRDLTALRKRFDSLINTYLHDTEKYARSDKQMHILRFVIQHSMREAGRRITYHRFGNSNYTSQAVSEALRALEKTHLLHLIHPVTNTRHPLIPDLRKAPRLQFFDTGLSNYFSGIQHELIGTDDLCKVEQGKIIEHLVGQELLSFQTLSLSQLHFWVRQKKQSDAEVDFVYPYKGKLVPIEVKSGSSGKLRSLHAFMDASPLTFAIRLYGGELSVEELTTQQGKSFHLLSLPYFLAAQIESYIDWLLQSLVDYQKEFVSILEEAAIVYQKSAPIQVHWNIESLTQKHLTLLASCSNGPLSGRALLEVLHLTYQSRNKREYLQPLLQLGLMDYTNKEYLKSKQQRYQLTNEGKAFLEMHGPRSKA